MTITKASERTIAIQAVTGDFAEDKDAAASLRDSQIRPAIAAGESVVLDFKGVRVATQSFIHALVSDILRTNGEGVLKRVTFRSCTNAVKGIVQTVVQYSLESIEDQSTPKGKPRPSRKKSMKK